MFPSLKMNGKKMQLFYQTPIFEDARWHNRFSVRPAFGRYEKMQKTGFGIDTCIIGGWHPHPLDGGKHQLASWTISVVIARASKILFCIICRSN